MSDAPARKRIEWAAQALEGILVPAAAPADKQLEAFFRGHRALGARDRAFVAEAVYACLRHRRSYAHLAGAGEVGALLTVHLARAGVADDTLTHCLGDAASAWLRHARALDPDAAPLAVRIDMPDWLVERLVAQFGETETLALAHALNRPAPVDLRVNTLKTEREALRAQLASEGFPTERTPFSPVGLRRHEREPLFHARAFREGLFEIQDEGSQLVSLLLEPKPRERAVDFCAGAGGKTLHLAALMHNRGTLYAFDTAPKRLEQLRPRLARAGADNVRIQRITSERDAHAKRLAGKIDRVLVDAPCSGTGTLRRNPDIKWRAVDLADYQALQQRILDAAARLVAPGGRLVYATCSLLREENEDVVEGFLSAYPDFTVVPAHAALARRHVIVPGIETYLRLLPHRHGTDGFFAAIFERRRA